MRQRRLLFVAAAAAAALTLTAGVPAEATSLGGGAITGTLSPCAPGASITIDSPAFVFNGNVGPMHAEGTTDCLGGSIIVDSGSGTFSLEGPGISCPSLGGVWQKIGTHFIVGFGGPCTFAAGNSHNVLFRGDAVIAAGTFVGEMFISPVL